MGEDDLAPAIRAKARAEAFGDAAAIVDQWRRHEVNVGSSEWHLLLKVARHLRQYEAADA